MTSHATQLDDPARHLRRRRPLVLAALAWSVVCGPVTAALLVHTRSAWLAMWVYHAGCAALAAPLASPGPRPPVLRLLVVGAVVAVVVVGACFLVLARVDPSHVSMSTWAGWGLTPPGDAWMLVYYVCVNPVIEEWFWRGAIVGRQLREHFGTRTAVFFGVGAFWGFHVFVLWPAFGFTVGLITSFFVLLAGIAWTLLRLRSGHIWWSGLTHLAANLALAILYFARLRGEV